MTEASSEESFKVTDRRHRTEDASPPGPGAAGSSLAGLFMMLGSSALVALGEAPDPATGEKGADLEAASELIDLLILLRERTEGRRIEAETTVLEPLIYDLQLRYVNARRRSG